MAKKNPFKKKKKVKSIDELRTVSKEFSEPMEPKNEKDGGDDDHEAEMALNDLTRAEKHKGNDSLMKRVAAKAGRHMAHLKGIKSIADLREINKGMTSKKDETEL